MPTVNFLRVTAVLRRHSRDGDILDSLGAFLFADVVTETLESRTDAATGVAYGGGVSSESPFGRVASWIAYGEQLYYGSSDSYEIQIFSKDGSLERIFRRPIPNEPITADDIEQFRDHFVGDDPQFESWARRRVNELEFPATKPAYGRVMVDALGNVWVAAFSLGNEDRSGEWTVFEPDGRMLGIVRVPPGGRIRDIGEDHLMGTWRTELDVEQVRMYRLLKN